MYKILIVEDEQVIAEQVCKYLEKWGYQAEYVKDFQHVTKEVMDFLVQKLAVLRNKGIKDIIVDPGFGFGGSLFALPIDNYSSSAP